ncbi:MAG TPA: DUF302 domain-containing protein [Mycobacteriales bacterium]
MALVTAESRHDVPTTVRMLTASLQRRGIRLFAAIDHGAGARDAGLELPDEVVLVFGNPAAGTPLMQADPRAGIDLPLRILVWLDGGRTLVAYRDPRDMTADFSLQARSDTLAALHNVLDQLVSEVAT